jgi:hypothetical protein
VKITLHLGQNISKKKIYHASGTEKEQNFTLHLGQNLSNNYRYLAYGAKKGEK